MNLERPYLRRKLGRPRLLIVGCGDIGARILARLNTRFRLFGTVRNAARRDDIRALGATPVTFDLDQPFARARTARRLQQIAALARWIVYLAPPPAAGSGDPRLQRFTHALAAARRQQARRNARHRTPDAPTAQHRFVYMSTTGGYGDHGGGSVDETTRLAPSTERARRRVAAERLARRAGANVLRVPGIYAADRLPLQRLIDRVPALIEADDVMTNHIHADDLAAIVIAAIVRGRSGRVYNAVDDSTLKMAAYFDRVADRFGLPRPPRMPRAQLRAALSPMAYSFMSESRQIGNARLKRELRVRLRYATVDAALAQMPDTLAAPSVRS